MKKILTLILTLTLLFGVAATPIQSFANCTYHSWKTKYWNNPTYGGHTVHEQCKKCKIWNTYTEPHKFKEDKRTYKAQKNGKHSVTVHYVCRDQKVAKKAKFKCGQKKFEVLPKNEKCKYVKKNGKMVCKKCNRVKPK